MARVKGGASAHARHRKVLTKAKGYYGRRKNCFRTAIQAVEKAGQYAYRDRRNKKRNVRALWIQRINAAVRLHGLNYSQVMNGLTLAGLDLDRKVLSDIAVNDAAGFQNICETAKKALDKKAA